MLTHTPPGHIPLLQGWDKTPGVSTPESSDYERRNLEVKSLEGGWQEGIHTDAFGVHPEKTGVRYRLWGHRFLSEAPADPDTTLAVSN